MRRLVVVERVAVGGDDGGLPLGRRTYDQWAEYWPTVPASRPGEAVMNIINRP
jgi:hypothetical protein